MLQRRIFGAGLAVLAAAAVAGCGGAGGGGGTASADGAGAAPAGSVAFISINSDATSQQWQQVQKLLKKFPGKPMLMQGLNSSLQQNGVDYDKDVKPALGDEVDLVWLDFQGGGNDFVGLTQPKNEKKFNQLIAKANAKGNSHLYSAKVGDWMAFAASQSALSTYKQRAKGDKLSGDKTFKDAMGKIGGDALVKAYVNGQAIGSAFNSRLASAGSTTPFGLDKLEYVAFAAKSQNDGLRFEGAAKSNDGRPLGTTPSFKSKLISGVPSGALAFLDFRGDGIQQQLSSLRNLPQYSQGLQQFERSFGVRLDQVIGLLGNENALYVRQGSPVPEISLVLEEPNQQQAMATLNRVAARFVQLSHARLNRAVENGLTVTTITLKNFQIHYTGFDGRILISNGPSAIRDYRSGGSKLSDDSVYKDATSGAGVPDKTSGIVYLNLKDGIPVVENFATTAGQTLPPQVTENLAPLRSFVAYGTGDSSLTKFTAFLQIK